MRTQVGIISSEAGRTILAEDYVGLPYEKFDLNNCSCAAPMRRQAA